MDPLIVIPTFISGRSIRRGAAPTEIYDHPTPINLEGELPRCLKSLSRVKDVGQVAVLVVSDPAIQATAEKRVRAMVQKFPALRVFVVGTEQARAIAHAIARLQVANLEREIGLAGYSAVRNLGLVLASVLGYDSVVFLDDDEIIDDPEFMQKAMYGLGKLTKRGIPILAKTGYYLNSEGSYHSLSQDRWYNRYWQQGEAFNTWIDKAMAGPRLSRSNHVCGGCLAIHREAFRRLAFDPWIVRGEDLDYLLNLRMYGSDMWFDNQWSLQHLPPSSKSEGVRFRQDIYRWLYEYRKVEYSRTQIDLHPITAASLEPYPGPFLEPGIDKRIKRTAQLRSLGCPDKAAYRQAARAATADAQIYAERNCAKYFEFQYVWPQIVQGLEGNEQLADMLLASFGLDVDDNAGLHGAIDPGATGEIRLNISDADSGAPQNSDSSAEQGTGQSTVPSTEQNTP